MISPLLSSFLMVSKASFITSIFFLGISPVSKNFNRSSTCSFNLVPKTLVACSVKQSILEAMEHLLAKNREMRPLFKIKKITVIFKNTKKNYQFFFSLEITFVFGSSSTNKGRVKNQSIFWSIALLFQGSKQGFFGT